jgi:hypothetical protein
MCQAQTYPSYGCQPCCCGTTMVSPYELAIASGGASAQAFVGGATPVRLSLEYVIDDSASSPSIKVTTVSGGSTSTWEETAPPSGYQVKSDFLNLQPGAKVTLDATEAAARLRWCETFCC